MDVQPLKKYRAPAYPMLGELKNKDFYKKGAFSKRQKMLITAATAVLCGSLAGCTPLSGVPAEESPTPPEVQTVAPSMDTQTPPLDTQTAGVPEPIADINEYEAYNAMINNADRFDDGLSGHAARQDAGEDDGWNEEKDIEAAFYEFLDWMRTEGVI